MGFSRQPLFSGHLFLYDSLGLECLPGIPRQVRGAAGFRYCRTDLLAGDHQPADGHGVFARGRYSVAIIQLRGIVTYDHHDRPGHLDEYSDEKSTVQNRLICMSSNQPVLIKVDIRFRYYMQIQCR